MTGVSITVEGLNDAMRILKEFDQEYYDTVRKELVEALQPIVTDARSSYPDLAMTNWGPWVASGLNPTRTGAKGTAAGRNLSYRGSQVGRRVRADVSRRRGEIRGTRFTNIAGGTQWSTAGAIFELAGRQTDSPFADQVAAAANAPDDPLGGRILPRAVRRNLRAVQQELGRIIDRLMNDTQRKLDAAGGVLIK